MIPAETSYSEMARRPLEAEQCALIVVDMQERLLPPIWEKERLLRKYWHIPTRQIETSVVLTDQHSL